MFGDKKENRNCRYLDFAINYTPLVISTLFIFYHTRSSPYCETNLNHSIVQWINLHACILYSNYRHNSWGDSLQSSHLTFYPLKNPQKKKSTYFLNFEKYCIEDLLHVSYRNPNVWSSYVLLFNEHSKYNFSIIWKLESLFYIKRISHSEMLCLRAWGKL